MNRCLKATIPAGCIPQAAALSAAAQAARENGCDPAALPLTETKATPVYDRENDACLYIVCYIVENEIAPYLSVTVDAHTGLVLDVSRANYFEIRQKWEEERQLAAELWTAEDRILFNTLYRKSSLYPRDLLPSKSDMPAEEAIRLAEAALQLTCGADAQTLSGYIRAAHLMEDPDGSRLWHISYHEQADGYHLSMRYQVTLNAATGAVVMCIDNENPGLG